MTHYFSEKQESELKLKKIRTILRNREFEFYSGSGVFSKNKIDNGTALLINKCIIKPKWHILDLGCGYGAVGIILKKLFDIKVDMIDINQRALQLTKKNAKLHNVEVNVFQSDLYSKIKEKYDSIIVNPPYVAGRKICFQIIEEAPEHLKKNGLFQLVARHNKGGKRLSEKMKEVFGNVETIAKKGGFRVYVSTKN